MPAHPAKRLSLARILLVVSLLLNATLLLSFLRLSSSSPSTTATVSRVIDGDTFDLTDNTRIRLAGADAPEYPKGCLSQQAKDRLEALVLGKDVILTGLVPDNFQRTVARAAIGQLDLARALISEGYAAAAADDPLLLSAQDEARAAGRGIWSDQCQSPPDPACRIKGNVRRDRGTRVYHRPDCYNWAKIVVNERDGDRWFCSPAEAESAGFTPSSDCPD